jgi:hypothetical protein
MRELRTTRDNIAGATPAITSILYPIALALSTTAERYRTTRPYAIRANAPD